MRYRGHNIKISLNNLTVSYTDEGPDDAPVILFIHGFPLNKSMWNNQVEAMSLNYRVIAYDIRGHGNSDSGSGDFSIEIFVNDLIALMDALKIQKAMLCGLSMGGYIALNAIENYPKRFDALILCDTNCVADTQEIREKRMNTIESISKDGLEQYAEESLKKLFTPESYVTNKEKIAAVKTMILETTMQSICKTIFALSRREETYSKLSDIKVHVLILVGEKDQLTPPSDSILMQKMIKGSILNIIEHAGHLSNLENSYEFNFQLSKFVSSVNQQTDTHMNSERLRPEVQNQEKTTTYEKIETELNAKILEVTMKIKDHYPELSKYLDEMPVTVPSEKDPEISLKHLSTYYESLTSLLNKYKVDYPKIEE